MGVDCRGGASAKKLNMLQCVAVCCSALQCVAVVQCSAVCCRVLKVVLGEAQGGHLGGMSMTVTFGFLMKTPNLPRFPNSFLTVS